MDPKQRACLVMARTVAHPKLHINERERHARIRELRTANP